MSCSKRICLSPSNGLSSTLDHQYKFSVRFCCPNLWKRSESHQFPFLRQIFCRELYLPNKPGLVRRVSLFVFENFSAERIKETRRERFLHSLEFSIDGYESHWQLICKRSFKLPVSREVAISFRLERKGLEGYQWTCCQCTYRNRGTISVCDVCGTRKVACVRGFYNGGPSLLPSMGPRTIKKEGTEGA